MEKKCFSFIITYFLLWTDSKQRNVVLNRFNQFYDLKTHKKLIEKINLCDCILASAAYILDLAACCTLEQFIILQQRIPINLYLFYFLSQENRKILPNGVDKSDVS